MMKLNGKSQQDITQEVDMNTKRLLRRARFWIAIGFLFLCSGPIMMNLWPEQNHLWSWTFFWGALVVALFPSKPRSKAEVVRPAKGLSQLAVTCVLVGLAGLVIRYLTLLNGKRLDAFMAGFMCLLCFGKCLSKWVEVEDASQKELRMALKEIGTSSPGPSESKV